MAHAALANPDVPSTDPLTLDGPTQSPGGPSKRGRGGSGGSDASGGAGGVASDSDASPTKRLGGVTTASAATAATAGAASGNVTANTGLANHDPDSKTCKPVVGLRELRGPDVEFKEFRLGAKPPSDVVMDVQIGQWTVTIQLPGAYDYFDEDADNKLPADMAVFAALGAELHGFSLDDWLCRVRDTVAELKQRIHQDCYNVAAIVLVVSCFDTLITCERLHDLLDLGWVSFDEDNSRPDYPLFPPTILTALVCVGIVCNNAMLLAHTLVAAATEYATERLPKLASTVLYAIVVDELITRDLARKLLAQLEDDDDAKHGFNLANLAKVVK